MCKSTLIIEAGVSLRHIRRTFFKMATVTKKNTLGEVEVRVNVTEFAPADFCKRVLADEGRLGSARYAGDAELVISQLADILLPGELGAEHLRACWNAPSWLDCMLRERHNACGGVVVYQAEFIRATFHNSIMHHCVHARAGLRELHDEKEIVSLLAAGDKLRAEHAAKDSAVVAARSLLQEAQARMTAAEEACAAAEARAAEAKEARAAEAEARAAEAEAQIARLKEQLEG